MARLANSLGYELVRAEAEKGQPRQGTRLDRFDDAWRGLVSWRQPPTKVNNDAARALFSKEEALQIDPDDADALAGEAFTYGAENVYGWTNPGDQLRGREYSAFPPTGPSRWLRTTC